MYKKECINCETKFPVYPYRKDSAKFCSRECYYEWKRGKGEKPEKASLIKKLYWERELSSGEIGEILDTSAVAVRHMMERYDIPRRNQSEASKLKNTEDRRKERIKRKYDDNLGEKLRHLYNEKHLTIEEIADIYDVSQYAVSNWMELFDIDRRSNQSLAQLKTQCRPPKEELVKLYRKEKKSPYEIADGYSVGFRTVYYWLEYYDIERFRNGRLKLPADFEEPSKKELKDLYLGEDLTLREIAKKFDTTKGTITRRMRKYGIEIKESRYGYDGKLECEDGHKVDSSLERTVDNWLFHHEITHGVHKKIGCGNYKCDFYIPEADTYIEIWGLVGEDYYDKRTKKKHKVYNKLGLKLIDIYPNDNFEEKLKPLLQYSKNQTQVDE